MNEKGPLCHLYCKCCRDIVQSTVNEGGKWSYASQSQRYMDTTPGSVVYLGKVILKLNQIDDKTLFHILLSKYYMRHFIDTSQQS